MQWFNKIRTLFHKPRLEVQMDDELRFHLEKLVEENVASGMSPEDARYAALRTFGNVGAIKEECRDSWGVQFISELLQDLRYGLRQLRRSPGFTAVAVLTLALGIGANTAIFSIVEAVFLRPLPFPHPDRIFVVDRVNNPIGGSSISMPIYLAWRQKASSLFDHLALIQWHRNSTLSSGPGSEQIPSAGATTDLFSVLGIHPSLGRNFLRNEGRPGSANVVILSNRLWRSRFGAQRGILGKKVSLNNKLYTVVGVLPRTFRLPIPGLRDADLWFPIQVPYTSDNPANGGILCLGLLKGSVSPVQAAAALTPPLKQLRQEFPKMFGPNERAQLEPLRSFLADWAGSGPLLLFGAVGLVLLLVSVNVATLSLTRSSTRNREIAIRTAIGAGRRRIVRQLLTESLLLALLGGALGALLCYSTFNSIVALVPPSTVHVGSFQIDGGVLVFALLLSIVTGLVFGLVPSLSASRVDLNNSLKDADLRTGSGGRSRLQDLLAASEVGISIMILIGAALVIESFAGLLRVRPGFDPNHLLTFRIALPQKFNSPARRSMFFDRALARLDSQPGVEQAGLINVLPFEGGGDILFNIVGGSGLEPSGEAYDADIRVASPGFFGTMRMPVLRGRAFSKFDNADSQPIVVINQRLAEICWRTKDPIGQRIWIGKPMGPAEAEPRPREIVGIVGNTRTESLARPPAPTMYIPFAQVRGAGMAAFVVRSGQDPLAIVPEVRNAILTMDPQVPITQIETMKDVMSSSLRDWRFHTILLATFGGLALLIAVIGIYGVISHSVAQRTHEIGIRMALGAGKSDVLAMVVRQGLKVVLVGVAIGIVGAFALTRFLASLLFGVKPTDPLTFTAVSLILIAVALMACYIPARRASKVDPMVALRYE